jgi:hypothetical protein
MYNKWKGHIDETFGFTAFRTAPLTSASAMDVKIANADLASRMMAWTVFGLPNERERKPTDWDKQTYSGNNGIYSSGYRVMAAYPTEAIAQAVKENEAERLKGEKPETHKPEHKSYAERVWKGWILPSSDSDLWLTMGSVAYSDALHAGNNWPSRLDAYRAEYRSATLDRDVPLTALKSDPASREWASVASHKGALVFDELRKKMGDDKFFEFMTEWYSSNTTKTVTTASFIEAADRANGKSLKGFFKTWLDGTGLPDAPEGPVFMASDISSRLGTALIVYGTTTDATANRYAAEALQRRWNDRYESEVPIRKDFEVTEAELATHDVVFIGRPETNSALHAWQSALNLKWEQGVFTAGGTEYASEYDALALAARNPKNDKRMVLVLAGNSALETVRAFAMRLADAEYQVFDAGKSVHEGFTSPK